MQSSARRPIKTELASWSRVHLFLFMDEISCFWTSIGARSAWSFFGKQARFSALLRTDASRYNLENGFVDMTSTTAC
jgi:hypothetical protein